MKKTLAIAATSAALVIAGMAPAHAADEPTLNIVELAVTASGGGAPDDNGGDYDLLVQAVLYTELAGVLSDPAADLTVFAPTDAAFLRLVEDLTGVSPASEADALGTIVGAYSKEQIASILTYHVVGGSLASADLRRAQSLTTVNGGTVKTAGINLKDETPALKDPKLVRGATDIHATNGVIHTIDRVLIPGNL